MDEYMSGSELRQYLHISTRKMKYFMDHDIIPHENTGQTTHKYRVRVEDAIQFKWRMDNEPGFLAEHSGKFSSHKEHHPRQLFVVTNESCLAFRKWLEREWADRPDALTIYEAAELLSIRPAKIAELAKSGVIHLARVKKVSYCPKCEVIAIATSVEKLSNPVGEEYQKLIRAFKKRQSREIENEKRRQKRKMKSEERDKAAPSTQAVMKP